MSAEYVLIQARDSKEAYRINYADLQSTFEVNMQLNSNYEVSFTLTYTTDYADVFNAAKPKAWVLYDGEWYVIQQTDMQLNDQGLLELKITATDALLDKMKNCRIDNREPTEDSPDQSGGASSGSSQQQQPGEVVKRTDEKQTYSLDDRMHKFIDGNDQGIGYELHGNFPNVADEIENTSLYEWLNNHLKDYSAYYIPSGNTVKIYDLPSLQHQTGRVFRYLHNTTNAEVQTEDVNIVNDCEVYGGKMEKDITVGGSDPNGPTEPVNGDWGPVAKTAAGLVGEKLSDSDINLIKAQINLESSGREDVTGGDDGLSDGPAIGLLQFKQGTFNYYCRPPYTNIRKGLHQLVALMNIPNWRHQITGHSGWSPHGAPISKATIVVQNTGDGWGWPFPSVGEGSFTSGQLFGVHAGNGRPNNFHDGLDFGSIDHPGNEVHAIHGGKVTISRAWGSGGVNWYLVIQDSTGLNVEYQEAFGSPNNIIVNVGDEIHTRQVIGYRTTNHLHIGITRHSFPEAFNHWASNDGTWLDPQAMIKNGGSGSSDSGSTSTTKQTYYSLHYHYHNDESVKKYGLHRGKIIKMDSIYDMGALQAYVDATVQHDPPTTLTLKDFFETGFAIGDVWRVVVPEMNLNIDVTLMGIKWKPFSPDKKTSELSFNNTGLTMKSVINVIYHDIHRINTNVTQINALGSIGGRYEEHFNQIYTGSGTAASDEGFLTQSQAEAIKRFTNGEE